jgi:butyryl-CoA dehydrogenase
MKYFTNPFVTFKNVRVPKENVLFPVGHLIEQMTMFNRERLANCIAAIFFAQAAFEFAKIYALNRRQFGTEVINSQVMQHYLADMATKIMAGRALLYHCASNAVDGLYPDGLLVSIAKNYATELAVEVTSRALRMCGGDGTRMDFPMQASWREAMQTTITGGTNEMLKDEIAQWVVPEKRLARLRDTAKALDKTKEGDKK